MSVYESVYYGAVGVAVVAVLLIIYLLYASAIVFTSHSIVLKSFMYLTAVLDAGFMGYLIRGVLCIDDQEDPKRGSI